jgi:hypothetical protein
MTLVIDWTDVKTNLGGDYIEFPVTPETTIGEINEALFDVITNHAVIVTPQWHDFEIYGFTVEDAEPDPDNPAPFPKSYEPATDDERSYGPHGKPKVNMVCRSCGGDNVMRDAWGIWSIEKQDWVLGNVFDAAQCDDCDGETSIEEAAL